MKKILLLTIACLLSLLSCGQDEVLIRSSDIQTEIISPQGTRVFIDVLTKNFAEKPFTADDILVVTFTGIDHHNAELSRSFPGRKLLFEPAVLEQDDIRLEMIPSARFSYDEITEVDATNYLLLMETGGLRILFCGDLGQDEFTDEQLERILPVDICFINLDCSFNNTSLVNKKAFHLIEELDPEVVIPLRYKDRSIDYAKDKWIIYTSLDPWTRFSVKNMPEETSLLINGHMAAVYHSLLDTPLWK